MSIIDNTYTVRAEDVDWKQHRCKDHPDRQAVVWINPPIGNFFCKECYKDLCRMSLQNKWRAF
jgi:hypothetical protein